MSVGRPTDPSLTIPKLEKMWYPLYDTVTVSRPGASCMAFFQNPAERPLDQVNLCTAGSLTWPDRFEAMGIEVEFKKRVREESIKAMLVNFMVGEWRIHKKKLSDCEEREPGKRYFTHLRPKFIYCPEENPENGEVPHQLFGFYVNIPPVQNFRVILDIGEESQYEGDVKVTLEGVLTHQTPKSTIC